ncbi:MAG: ribosomal RNA small subunit methyltransferase A, partial [Ignavibacteria bacterium]|nr:ribosomal RNA small subunit methyltransferase A [Ignavibacteria bacterium]
VAQRLIAAPGTKEYGILSVVFQRFASVELLFKVSPNVFFPKPKVWSAVIKIDFSKGLGDRLRLTEYTKVVRAAFNNRRKVLRNSLKNCGYSHINFDNAPVDLLRRAEELSVEDFQLLTDFIYPRKDIL